MNNLPLEILIGLCLNFNVLEYIRAKQTCSYLYEALTSPYFKAKWIHQELVDELKRAKTINQKMCIAAKHGNEELVHIFISKGADDWDRGMQYAALGGHIVLVQLFISKGTESNPYYHFDWNRGLVGAVKCGHKDLVELFIPKAYINSINGACEIATETGRIEILKLLLSHCDNESPFICMLYSAIRNNNVEIAKLLLPYCVNVLDNDEMNEYLLKEGFCIAAGYGHKDLVELFISKISSVCDLNLNMALFYTAINCHEDTMILLMNHGADLNRRLIRVLTYDVNWDEPIDAVRLLIKHGADNFDEALIVAEEQEFSGIVEILRKHIV